MTAERTILLVHHSHTDVGYTDPLGRVALRHADFIRQALEIAARRPDFRWQCEGHWGVERFWEEADDRERAAFVAAVRAGAIGLSGSYLNFSELIGDRVFRAVTRRAADFAATHGLVVDSAMTADVNGHGWGMGQAWHDLGVRNLFACVHTHHGRWPLDGTLRAFWWETPRGDRLLVFSGEHYHYGNELGFAPGACASYLTKDDCDADMIFGDPWGVAERRIPRYLAELDRRGYPFSAVPLMISGLRTDNAPPSEAVFDQVERWNREHGDVCRVEMATLSDVFARLRDEDLSALPVHSGDWPDWWSDGPAGDPGPVRLFRAAQRTADLVAGLHERRPDIAPPVPAGLDEDLALFAEHTFGHCDSVTRPWGEAALSIAARKHAYAARAYDTAAVLRDRVGAAMGESGLRPNRGLRWKVVCPLDRTLRGAARLAVGHHEFNELGLDGGLAVRDAASGEDLPCQPVHAPGGAEVLVPVALAPDEARILELRPAPGGARLPAAADAAAVDELVTEHVEIGWRRGQGLILWRDPHSGEDLARDDCPHGPFTLIRELTPCPAPADLAQVRGAMGLNRKGVDVVRDPARLRGARAGDDGPVIVSAVLDWEVDGLRACEVELAAHRGLPRVDVTVRLHKESLREPENLYLALPFTIGRRPELRLDKAGAAPRPRRDQIPGTLTDYYAVQGGFALDDGERALAVAMPDGHLLQLGPLNPGERLLAGDPRLRDDPAHAYAWLMTNYWETNFAAASGGCHAFRFTVAWGPELAGPDAVSGTCLALATDPWCLRL